MSIQPSSPHLLVQGLVADAKGALDASGAHPILRGSHDLILELLVASRPLGREGERVPARHAPRSLRPACRVSVLLKMFAAAAVRTGMHGPQLKTF